MVVEETPVVSGIVVDTPVVSGIVVEELANVKLEDDEVRFRTVVVVDIGVHTNRLKGSRKQVMDDVVVVVGALVMLLDVVEVEERVADVVVLDVVDIDEDEEAESEVEEGTSVLSGMLYELELTTVEEILVVERPVVDRPVVDTPVEEVECSQVSTLEDDLGSEENVVPCLSLRRFLGTWSVETVSVCMPDVLM